MTPKFSISEAVTFGWNTMRANVGFFIALVTLTFSIHLVTVIAEKLIGEGHPFVSIVIFIATWMIGLVLQVVYIRVGLRFYDGEECGLEDLLASPRLLAKLFVGGLLYGVVVLIGLLLLILPGVIWAMQFQFFSYLLVDKGLGLMEAFKRSAALTKGSRATLFFFWVLLFCINLAGVLALLVGLYATIPTTIVALAAVYRKLLAQAEAPPARAA